MSEIELKLVPLLCDSSSTSVDIGAYLGEYTKIMSQHSKFVYSFEPIPKRYYNLLKKRFVKGKNVAIHQIALSDTEQTKYIHIPHFKNRFHEDYALDVMSSMEESIHEQFKENKAYLGIEKLLVQTKTLDSFNLYNTALIKIDVEGHELAVLSGAKNTIRKYRPNIIIEMEERHKHNSYNDANILLNNLGYKGYFIYNGKILPFKEFDVQKMQILPLEIIKNRPTSNIPCYVNNFLFFHKSKDIANSII